MYCHFSGAFAVEWTKQIGPSRTISGSDARYDRCDGESALRVKSIASEASSLRSRVPRSTASSWFPLTTTAPMAA